MTALIEFLSGKKTYVVAACATIYALVQYWAGSIDANQMTQMLLGAAGLAGLRAGVTKSGVMLVPFILAASLAACTPAQVQTVQTDVNAGFTVLAAACADAQIALGQAQAVVKGGAANTVNSLGGYVTAGCSTAAAAQKLASDPTSLQWLGQIIGALNTLKAG